MMKRNLILAALAAVALMAGAQSKISPQGRLMLNDYRNELRYAEDECARTGIRRLPANPSQTVIVTLSEETDIANAVAEAGGTVVETLGDMLLVNAPLSAIEAIAAIPEVKSISMGGTQDLNLNFARPACGVDAIQEGFVHDGTTVSFDGTGVVAGFYDTGLEANHINFKDENGNSRFGRLFDCKNSGKKVEEYTPATISKFSTDNDRESHATHVAGIMAGSYRGEGDFTLMNAPDGDRYTKKSDQPIPYYGVAPGATLAGAVGELDEGNILAGLSGITKYAKEIGYPVVINMSLGSTIGPHDGSDAYTRYVSKIGETAVVCVSAGNEGRDALSIVNYFEDGDNSFKTLLKDNRPLGYVDVWSNNSTPLTVSWLIYDLTKKQFRTLLTTTGSEGSAEINESNADFKAGFVGKLRVAWSVDPNNNRFNVYTVAEARALASNSSLHLVLQVEGEEGQVAYVYGRGVEFASNGWVGFINGTNDQSINNTCCGKNVISVGAYTTRPNFAEFGGGPYVMGDNKLGQICSFSSFGTSFQGQELPTVAGPGAVIVSSINRYNVKTDTEGYIDPKNTSGRADSGLTTDYWAAMQGTSMSSPYVAGCIALWLQANPYLHFSDVMDVMDNTCVRDAAVRRAPERFGYGKIDALQGLIYVLQNRSSVGNVVGDDTNVVILPVAGGYDVVAAGASGIQVTMTALDGRTVGTYAAPGDRVAVSTDGYAPAVYLMTVATADNHVTRKVLVK